MEKRTLLVTLPLALTLVFGLLAPSALAEKGGAERTKARLDKGEIIVRTAKVKGSDYPEVIVTAVVETAPERLWAIIEKCDDYEKTMPRVKEATELSRKGNKVVCKVTIEMPFPLSNITNTTQATHTVVPGKKYRRAWKLLEGDMKDVRGSWTLIPFEDPNRTLVVYRTHAEPAVAIPAAIQKAAQKKSLPNMIKKLRELTRS